MALDFNSLKNEMLAASQALTQNVKTISRKSLYNKLQDVEPGPPDSPIARKLANEIVLIDTRLKRQFDNGHIRCAMNIRRSEEISTTDEIKFEHKLLVFYDTASISLEQNPVMNDLIAYVKENIFGVQKMFFLKGGITSFAARYAFLLANAYSSPQHIERLTCPYPTEVESSFLFLGDVSTTKHQLIDLEIAYVLNVAQMEVDIPRHIKYLHIPTSDSGEGLPLKEGAEFIRKAFGNCAKILICCETGHCKSAAIIAAYFVKWKRYKHYQSLAVLRNQRKPVRLSAQINMQLKLFEGIALSKETLKYYEDKELCKQTLMKCITAGFSNSLFELLLDYVY